MSLVKNEAVENMTKELEVFIDAETFKNACNRAYLRQVKRIKVSGFRKGKAPKKVIEKLYGPDVFFDSAIDLVYPQAVDSAVKKAGIEIVGLEKLEPIEVSEETGCKLKVVCVLKPEAKIENYKGIEIKASQRKVEAVDVQNQIDALKERCGKLVSVNDRAAAANDVVFLDFEGFIDGKPFGGGASKNHRLKLGSGQFIEGFEDQVIGHKVGDEFEVNVVFPQNYHEASLIGKPAKFKCKLNEIKFMQLPEEDDEFAKDVSKFDTLKELKDDIKSKLEDQFKNQFDSQIDSGVTNFLAKNVVVQIPEIMLLNRTDELAKNFENNLAGQGFNLDQYLSITGMSGYDLKDNIKVQAKLQLKVDLALEKIAKLEKIEPSSDDYEKERARIADIYKIKDVEEVKRLFPDEVLKLQLTNRKAFNFVKNNAKISAESSEKKLDGEPEVEGSKVAAAKTAKTSQTKPVKKAKINSNGSKKADDSESKSTKGAQAGRPKAGASKSKSPTKKKTEK